MMTLVDFTTATAKLPGWSSSSRTESALMSEVMVSPADAEKVVRKHGFERKDIPNLFEGIIERPRGKPTLAPIADKRPALVNLSGVEWDSESETEES